MGPDIARMQPNKLPANGGFLCPGKGGVVVHVVSGVFIDVLMQIF